MTVLVESAHDAQILPPGPGAGKATISAWTAYLACDADTRTKHAAYRDIAARLEPRKNDDETHR